VYVVVLYTILLYWFYVSLNTFEIKEFTLTYVGMTFNDMYFVKIQLVEHGRTKFV